MLECDEWPDGVPAQGTDAWLDARLSGIGGSEISALYRLDDGRCASPWMSPTELWALKTRRIPCRSPDPWEAPHLYVGRVLELPVREMYQTYSGRTVRDGVTLRRDSVSPVLLASTDGEQSCPSRPGELAVYEGKVTTVFRRQDWIRRVEDPATGDLSYEEIVPLHYRCQTQHYMACTGLTWSSVAAFMQADRSPIHWRDIDRHEAFIDDMRERAARWWRDYVVADVEPPTDDASATEDALRAMHKKAEDIAVILPAAFAAVLDRLDAIAHFQGVLKRERQRLRNIVLSTMGRAVLGVIAEDGRGWSWRGESSRALRSLAASGVERARRQVETSRAVYVPADLGQQLDELYTISMHSLAEGQTLSAKAIHLAHLAVKAAETVSE